MDALERDFYEERRRRWRRSAFWRGFWIAAILCLVLAVLAWGGRVALPVEQIARVEISGLIADDPARDRLLADLAEAGEVRAVVLRINSPGGTTAGSEALFASLREIADAKPLVAALGEVAASGGYVAAIAADHVVARGNTLTGSIGVILEYPDLSGLIARLGVEMETVRSSPLKGEPSPLRPSSPAARGVEEALVADSYAWFRALVAERRGIEGPALEAAANGQVFTGRLALERGLIDEIGGEREALAWLESSDPALEGLPVEDWGVEPEAGLLGPILGALGPSGGILGEIPRFLGVGLYSLGP